MKNFLKEKIDKIFKISILGINDFFSKIGIRFLNLKTNKKTNKLESLNNIFEILKHKYTNELPNELSHMEIIDRNFIIDLAYITQITLKKSEINIDHGKILYALSTNMFKKNLTKKFTIVETGTAKGFSSICMAKAIYDTEVKAQIFTFDLIGHSKKSIWNNISDIHGPISRKEMIHKWRYLSDNYIHFISGYSHLNIKNFNFNNIDFAFIDGSHYGHDIYFEFMEISKYQLKGDQILFDDYDHPNYISLTKTIDRLCNELEYEKFKISGFNDRNYLLATKI